MCCSSWVRFSEDQRRLDNWIGSRRSLRLRLTRVASHVNLSVWWNVLVWRPCQCRVSCVCQVFGPLPEFLPALCWCPDSLRSPVFNLTLSPCTSSPGWFSLWSVESSAVGLIPSLLFILSWSADSCLLLSAETWRSKTGSLEECLCIYHH